MLAAPSNLGSDTPLPVVSMPSLSDHNSDIFAKTDGTEDMRLSASNNIQYNSDSSNSNIPDTTINHNIEPNYNTIMDKIIPSSERAPSLSVQTNDNTIADKIVPTSEHAPSLSGQTNNVPDLADANPSESTTKTNHQT